MDTTWHGDDRPTSEGHKAKAHYRDGWVWGLGANNMKSGLASALAAIEAIAKEGVKLKGDVLFGAVVGEIEKAAVEEFKGLWLTATAPERATWRPTVSPPILPFWASRPVYACDHQYGRIWAKIAVAGTLSHSARARSGDVINAIEEMHDLHTNLRQWIADDEAGHKYRGEHPNVTISAIRGGMPWRAAANPFECRIYLAICVVPGTAVEDARRSLRKLLRDFAAGRKAPKPTLDFYVTSPPTELSDDSSINRVMRGRITT